MVLPVPEAAAEMIRPGGSFALREAGGVAQGAVAAVVVGGVKAAVVKAAGSQGATDKDDGGPLDPLWHGDGCKGAPDDLLIGP